MDIYSRHDWNESAWQATTTLFVRQFKGKIILAGKKDTYVQPPKELTTEAVSVIVVITIFIFFAVLGSLSTAFDFLYAKKKKLNHDTDNEECTNNLLLNGIKKTSIRKGWLSNSRSFLQCFCFVKNGKKLFQTNSDKDLFVCLHGIRFYSNFAVIFFHVSLVYFPTIRSLDKVKPFMRCPISMLLRGAPFSVDAFFVISGFLNAHSFSKEYDKNNGKIQWWNFYLKRFLRLTPVYMIVLGIYTTLLSYTGSGPIWPEYATNPVCKVNWWRYLLYINNFQSSLKSCMLWCWHLAAEMQLYVVSPVFLLSLLRWPRFGYGITSTTILLSCLSNFAVTKQCNLIEGLSYVGYYLDDIYTFLDRYFTYSDNLYVMPNTRISSYLIGVLLGYYLHDKNFKDTRNNLTTLCCGWMVAMTLMCISFFALFNRKESVLEAALYNSVKHLFFSVGLSWIIFVCLTRQGGFINTFLSWKLYFPFANLSYCAYMIHLVILQRDYQAAQDLEEFSYLLLALKGLRVYFWTFVISFPLSLLFELPIINLFYLYTKQRRDLKHEERKKKSD